jgi:hypothetical protein
MTELHFQRGKLEISYDADNDVLWMANDKPAPRGFDIIKNQVIAFFDYDGTTPTAIMVFDAAELLSPFFDPSDGNVSESTLVLYGEQDGKEREAAIGQFLNPDTRKSDSLVVIHRNDDGDRVFEKFLKAGDRDIYYQSEGDTLSVGNGRPAGYGGHEIAEGLMVFFEAEGVPVHIEFFDAAELLTPILSVEQPSKTGRLI